MQAGQYFSGFLEAIAKLGSRFNYTKQDIASLSDFLRRAKLHGVLFSLGEIIYDRDEASSYVADHDLPRNPPYPVCILEYKGADSTDDPTAEPALVIAVEAKAQDSVLLIPIRYYRDQKAGWLPPFFAIKLSYDKGDTERYTVGIMMPDAYKESEKLYLEDNPTGDFGLFCISNSATALQAYLGFCKTLHENEVTFTDVVPDKKANQMRRARGKAPLFTYKTLTIGGPKQQGHGKGGGTHASPRSHLRRGHYRTLKSGKRIWINSFMVVGNGEGFVHKDYKVLGGQDGGRTSN